MMLVSMAVDDVVVAHRPATDSRPNVGAVYVGYGAAHGFTMVAGATAGPHRVCVDAIDDASGSPGALGCVDLDVR